LEMALAARRHARRPRHHARRVTSLIFCTATMPNLYRR
jgi:hypothetical protein